LGLVEVIDSSSLRGVGLQILVGDFFSNLD